MNDQQTNKIPVVEEQLISLEKGLATGAELLAILISRLESVLSPNNLITGASLKDAKEPPMAPLALRVKGYSELLETMNSKLAATLDRLHI
jgi:hypothetical protein